MKIIEIHPFLDIILWVEYEENGEIKHMNGKEYEEWRHNNVEQTTNNSGD